ncbi:MAG: M20/M25/M40 family metallo-hydrolase [Actinomycetota bacterium]
MPAADLVHTLEGSVDRDAVVALTSLLVETPSVNDPRRGTPSEAAAAEVLADALAAVGMTVEVAEEAPGRPNVIARWSSGRPGPTMLMSGHLDTVGIDRYEDPFVARQQRGRIYGRGSCDMKGGLAAIVEACRLVIQHEEAVVGDLLVIGTVDEEEQMIGSSAFVDGGPVADFALVAEPTNLVVCPAHKGQLGLTITTTGRSVHSSVPREGVNAIAHMGRVLEALAGYERDLGSREPHPICGTPTMSPGVIAGGDYVSQVPDHCELQIDRRFLAHESLDTLYAEIRAVLDPIGGADPTFRYELSAPTILCQALDTPVESPLVAAAVDAVTAIRGSATVAGLAAATDAPHFGCPAIICGPGALAQAHTLDEWVEIDELVEAAAVFAATAMVLLSP